MKDNKKKLAIVALLAVVVLGIGAFQFTRGSGQAPPSEKKKEAPKDEKEQPKTPEVDPSFIAAALPQRDPFQAGTLDPYDPSAPVTTEKPPVKVPRVQR